jgi:hypothetical protein
MSTLTPEFGEEGEMSTQEAVFQEEGGIVPAAPSEEEHELAEHNRGEREVVYLDAEENELRAPGEVCARCHQTITAGQDVRRRVDGTWMHEVCPPNPGGAPVVES